MNKYSGISKYIKNPEEVFNFLKNKTIIFLDTETTGLNPSKNQITEIAAVAVSGPDFKIIGEFDEKIELSKKTLDQIEKEKENYIKDPKFFGVEKALSLNKYYDNQKKGKDELEVLKDFKNFVSKFGRPILIAHNASFDMSFIGNRIGKLPNEGVYDTMKFSRLFFIPAVIALSEQNIQEEKDRRKTINKPKKEIEFLSSKLEHLLEAFKIDKGSLHTALVDVTKTAELFKQMMNYFKKYSKIHEDLIYQKEHKKRIVEEIEKTKKKKSNILTFKRDYYMKKDLIEKVKIKLASKEEVEKIKKDPENIFQIPKPSEEAQMEFIKAVAKNDYDYGLQELIDHLGKNPSEKVQMLAAKLLEGAMVYLNGSIKGQYASEAVQMEALKHHGEEAYDYLIQHAKDKKISDKVQKFYDSIKK
jgi:DNA polymerase III epsilon subunit-like protein